MKLFMKLLSLVVLVGLFAVVPANAQHKKDKPSFMQFWQGNNHDGRDRDGRDHNGRDRDGRDHDGRDRDGRDHHGRDHHGCDNDTPTDIAITVINDNPDFGTITGPSSVPSGGSATFDIVPGVDYFFTLYVDGIEVSTSNVPYSYTIPEVTAPLTVEVTFFQVL